MKKNFQETDFQIIVKQWINKNKNKMPNCLCESKISKGKTILFSSFRPQQIPSLKEAGENGLYFKLTDASIGLKPADFFFIKGGYVALMFETKKQQNIFYLLNIKYVLRIQDSGAKLITIKDAEKFGVLVDFSKK